MSLSHEVVIPIDLATALEFPIYAPGEKVVIEKAWLVPGANAAKEAVNFTTIQILDKGSAGTDNTVVASIKTEDVAAGVALTAKVKQEIPLSAFYNLSYALTLKKIDAGAAVDLQESAIILRVRKNG